MWRNSHGRIRPEAPIVVTSLRWPALILIALLAASGLPAAAAPAPPVRITAVSVKTLPGIVAVAIAGTGPLRFKAQTMRDPSLKILVDVSGAVMDKTVPKVVPVDRAPVLRVRTGQFKDAPPVARVVIDLAAPLAYEVRAVDPDLVVARVTLPSAHARSTPVPPKPVARVTPKPLAQATSKPVAQATPAPTPRPTPPPPRPTPTTAPAPATPRPTPAPAQSPPPSPAAVAQVPPSRISLDLRNTEIADVLNALAKLCVFNIVTDASVKGTITVRLIDVTCDEALRFILEANGLGFRRIGRNIIVMAAEKLAPPPEVPEAVVYPLGYANVDQVRAAIAAAVPGIRVAVDPRTNAIVVFGTPTQQEQVQKILASLDVRIAQIMIETRVVDINTSVLKTLGIDWGLGSVPIIQGVGSFPGNFTIGIAGPMPPGTSAIAFLATLALLVTQGKARVITAPRVAVLEGNEAEVNLGQDFPIPQRDANGNITFTFRPVGVILKITPRLNPDGVITTTVSPEVSSVVRLLTSGGLQVPIIASRKARTIVQVRSGESIVIAGLISTEERVTTIKVPLLGDLPVLGYLFRHTTTDVNESEVIFVITPFLVDRATPTPPGP